MDPANYLSTMRPKGEQVNAAVISSYDYASERKSIIEWFAYNLFRRIFEWHVENPNRRLGYYTTPLQLKIGNTHLTAARMVADKAIRIVQATLDFYLNFDYISLTPDDLSRVEIDIPEDVFKNLKFPMFSRSVTLYNIYKSVKKAHLSSFTINTPLEQQKVVDLIVYKLMRLIIKNQEKPAVIEGKNHRIIGFASQDHLHLQTQFKIITKAVKIVLTNLGLPTWSRRISVTADPSEVFLDFPKSVIEKIKVPLGTSFNQEYLTKKKQMPQVDLSYLRPSGQRLYKMVINEKETPEEIIQKAVDRYAFNLMKVILTNAKGNPNQDMSFQFAPLQFSSISSIVAKSVSEAAIPIVLKRLKISYLFSSSRIDPESPSLVSIKIPGDLVQKINFPIPLIPTTINSSTLGNLLYTKSKDSSAKPNPNLITILTEDGNLRCHPLVLETRDALAFQHRLDISQNKINLPCSLRVAKIFVEWAYTDNVTLTIPDTIKEAKFLISLGHEFSSSLLKAIGIKILAEKLTIDTFIDIDITADQFNLKTLLEFCRSKLDFNSSFKNKLEEHLIDLLKSLSSDFVTKKIQEDSFKTGLTNIEKLVDKYQLNKVSTQLKEARDPKKSISFVNDKGLLT